jgi:putative redox protein
MPELIWSDYPIEVVWEGGKRYRGGKPEGPTHLVDGEREVAPSPVEGMLVALGACSSIDVVEILEKRRTPATALSVRVDFARAPTPPRRLTAARLVFRVTTESERNHVERAIQLSFEKYCSVATSLAPDTQLDWSLELSSPTEGAR